MIVFYIPSVISNLRAAKAFSHPSTERDGTKRKEFLESFPESSKAD